MVEEKINVIKEQMMNDIFVVSGNLREYQAFINSAYEQLERQIKRHQVRFVYSPPQLEISRPARVMLVGNYFKRKDWERMEKTIKDFRHRSMIIKL